MQSSLTPRQQRFFYWVEDFIAERGMAPVYREIQDGLGYRSLAPVTAHLENLKERGYLTYDSGKARSIQILRPSRRVPLLGTIAAHSLVTIVPDHKVEFIDLSGLSKFSQLSRHELGQHFGLRVRGDSMIRALIADGDVVVMRHWVDSLDQLKDKTIVAARVNDATTLKYFYRQGSLMTLKPANPRYKPTTIDSALEEVEIQGVYVGVLRDLV
jgi:repressor LexA